MSGLHSSEAVMLVQHDVVQNPSSRLQSPHLVLSVHLLVGGQQPQQDEPGAAAIGIMLKGLTNNSKINPEGAAIAAMQEGMTKP